MKRKWLHILMFVGMVILNVCWFGPYHTDYVSSWTFMSDRDLSVEDVADHERAANIQLDNRYHIAIPSSATTNGLLVMVNEETLLSERHVAAMINLVFCFAWAMLAIISSTVARLKKRTTREPEQPTQHVR